MQKIYERYKKSVQGINYFEYLFLLFIILSLTPILFALFGIHVRYSQIVLYPTFILLISSGILKAYYSYKENPNSFTIEKLKNPFLMILITALTISFIGKVVSVIGFTIPILHDPYSHARWAIDIVESGKIDYFYSPLLHTLTVSIHYLTNLAIPKIVILLHGILSFVIPLQFSYLVWWQSKNKNFALAVLLVMSALLFPMDLYYTAGKNALVLGLFVIPYLIYFLMKFFQREDRLLVPIMLLLFSAISLFLAHYPTFVIIMLILLPPIGLKVFEELRNNEYRHTSSLAMALTLTILFVAAWLYPRYHVHFDAERVSPIVTSISNNEALYNILVSIRTSYENLIGQYLVFGVLTLIITFSKKFDKYMKITYIGIFSLLLFEPIAYQIIPEGFHIILYTIAIFRNELIILSFLYWIFYYYYTSGEDEKSINLTLTILLTPVLLSNLYLFYFVRSYHHMFSVVDNSDQEIFDYINKNLPEDCKILNSAIIDRSRPNITFPVDGGLWIPALTKCENTTDFLSFDNPDSHKYAKMTSQLKQDVEDEVLINSLIEEGIFYIYIDHDSDDSLKLVDINEEFYTVLHKSNDSYLLEIKDF